MVNDKTEYSTSDENILGTDLLSKLLPYNRVSHSPTPTVVPGTKVSKGAKIRN